MLQEGINEAGAMASWIAAATSYSNSNTPMIPFYIYYSMFGFQRVHDLAWAAGDMRARGFLLGGTSGRTTLNGEGLQHEDGHSHILSATIPNCVSYDPTFSYEVAVIIQHGLERMYGPRRGRLLLPHPAQRELRASAMPEGAEEGIVKGMYLLKAAPENTPKKKRITLLGSGAILREVIAGGGAAGARFRHLRRHLQRHQLHRTEARRRPGRALEHAASPGRAARSLCDAMPFGARRRARWSPRPTTSALLRADPRLRAAGVTRFWARTGSGAPTIAGSCAASSRSTGISSRVAALKALADAQLLPTKKVAEAIDLYRLDPEKPDPTPSDAKRNPGRPVSLLRRSASHFKVCPHVRD